MTWQLIESDDDLALALAEASDASAVAVDTEFMRRNTFYPQAALLQLCFNEKAWLIDPLAIEDPGPLIELLENPAIIKILHSASEDLEVFQHWLGVLPQPLFDTQRAAALLDRGFGLGYRALVQSIEGVELPKGETRSDWLQRPLTESQCEYAALDVTHLLPVWRELRAACDEAGKTAWVLNDGRDAVQGLASGAANYYTRIKSAWKLSARQLGVLAAVSEWREATARSRDKPRSWIIDDKACLQLAQVAPQDWSALKDGVELPAPVQRRYGDTLLEIVAGQRALPDSALPERLPPPLDGAQRSRLKMLKTRAREIAVELATAPEILLAARDYELLLREAAGHTIVEPPAWSGWRGDAVVAPLRQRLEAS